MSPVSEPAKVVSVKLWARWQVQRKQGPLLITHWNLATLEKVSCEGRERTEQPRVFMGAPDPAHEVTEIKPS